MNKQIVEDYCSFEIAKLLKEKGFDIPCRQAYFNGSLVDYTLYGFCDGELLDCPSQSLALKWLREVHNLHIYIFIGEDSSCDADGNIVDEWHFWTYYITNTSGDMIYDAYNKVDVIEYQTHEEAVEAAIKYTLENLI